MILSLIEFLILFFILIVSYFNAKNFFFSFVYTFFILGQFILFKIGNELTPTVFNIVLFAIIILFLASGYILKYTKYFFLYLLIYIGYFIFLFFFNGINLGENLILYKNFFCFSLLALLLMENIQKGTVSPRILVQTILSILCLESCIGIAQYIYPPLTNFFRVTYEWGGIEFGLTAENQIFQYDIYVLGTFLGPSAYAGYLMITLVSVLFMDILGIFQLNRKHVVIIILGSLALLLTGIRSPFLIYLMTLFYYIYKRQKKIFVPILIIFSCFIILNITFLQSLSNVVTLENPIERVVSGFAILSGDLSKLEGTTFILVIAMISYVLKNPLLGVGLHNKSGYYLFDQLTLEDLSTTDSQLLFTIAEIGLIGLIISLYPYCYLSRKINSKYVRKEMGILLVIFLIATLIDSGIFALYSILTLFILYSLCINNNKEIREHL